MAGRRGIGTVLALAAVVAAGCCARPRQCPPPALATGEAIDLCADPGEYRTRDPDLIRDLTEHLERTTPGPRERPVARRYDALALSGGGKYGAFSAGVLAGWSASGARPPFDVVTGVSTGALIATFAFLGPEYDETLRRYYTSTRAREVYRRRSLPGAFLFASFATSVPLRRLIEDVFTDDVIRAVARAHAEGRRLFIGTTNIDTKRLVVWDMGAIASRGGPGAFELFRTILLASASVPGFFPAVPIEVEVNGKRYTELHADGGVTAQIFFRTSLLNIEEELARSGPRPLAGSNLYAIVAGKLYVDPVCVRPKLFSIAGDSLSGLLFAMGRNDLYRMFTIALVTGMHFQFAALRQDFPVGGGLLSFDPDQMRRLYDEGFRAGLSGEAWRATPPGTEPEEQSIPRAGVRFVTPEAGPSQKNPG
jgi:predicted patatin/cPLA2 family phospholipase